MGGIKDIILKINNSFSNNTYRSIYNRFPTKPSQYIASLQQQRIINLINGGVWNKLDTFYLINMTEDQSSINWIKNKNTLVRKISTSFTSLFNFQGHTVDESYMETDFNPKRDGVNYTNSAASIGCYMNTNVEEDHTFLFGNSSGGSLINPATGMICRYGSWQGKVNNGGGTPNDLGEFYMPGRNAGFVVWVRNVSGKIKGYFNGYPQSESVASVTGTDLLNDTFYVFKNKYTGLNKSDNGIAFMFEGGALTDADVALLYTEIHGYLTDINAAESFNTSKLVDLNFEDSLYINKGFWGIVAGTPDFNYTVTPISGTKSAYFPNASEAILYFPVYTGNISCQFKIKFPDATPAANSDFFTANVITTRAFGLKLYTSGRILLTTGGKTNFGTTVLSDNTIYNIWVDYLVGTGANSECRMYISTTTTKPSTPECIVTGGNSTLKPSSIRVLGIEQLLDDLKIFSI